LGGTNAGQPEPVKKKKEGPKKGEDTWYVSIDDVIDLLIPHCLIILNFSFSLNNKGNRRTKLVVRL
jgi:hypothetical protein